MVVGQKTWKAAEVAWFIRILWSNSSCPRSAVSAWLRRGVVKKIFFFFWKKKFEIKNEYKWKKKNNKQNIYDSLKHIYPKSNDKIYNRYKDKDGNRTINNFKLVNNWNSWSRLTL